MREINQDLLMKRYAQAGETTWEQIAMRVAKHAAKNDADVEDFYSVIFGRNFLPSRMTYMGTDFPFAASCFVFDIEDNLESIMTTLKEACHCQKYGGGTGYDFSQLRPKGDIINTSKGEASGPVSFMKLYHNAMEVVNRAGKKHAAQMGILRCDHPDIFEFIHCKDAEGALWTFNISVAITDHFMAAVKADAQWPLVFDGVVYKHVSAAHLWSVIVDHAWHNGDPGVIFIDTVNRYNKYPFPIRATNPCWTGDTQVWTIYGPKSFRELAETGADVPVLTQTADEKLTFRWMRNPRKTRNNVALVKIRLDDGTTLRCTPDHNIYLRDGRKVQAQNLQAGDSIASVYRYKANAKGYQRLTNGKDMPLEHHVAVEWNAGRRPNWPAEHVHHKDGDKQNNAPENLEILPANEHNRMNMMGEDNPMSGVWDERNPLFGRDVSGKNNPRYRHDIEDSQIQSLVQSGASIRSIATSFGCSPLMIRKRIGLVQSKKEAVVNHKVVSVENLTEAGDVYNGTVDETHRYFVMDKSGNAAILSANCGEIPQPSHFACNLGSIDLSRHIHDLGFDRQMLRVTVHRAVRFLDGSIENAYFPVEQIRKNTAQYRNIGIGVMGWADALVMLGIPYDSEEAVKLGREIMAFIQEMAEDESMRLGGGVRRNVTLTAIAPTGSISMLADCSSGIEPLFGIVTTKNTYVGTYYNTHWLFEKIARARGFYSEALLELIALTGTVQYSPEVPDDVKRLFKTTNEIGWEWHVKHQAAFQAHTDQSVSKTVNLPNSATTEDVGAAYWMAFETACKSITVYRDGSRQVQVVDSKKQKRQSCPNCQAILFMDDGHMKCVSCGYVPEAAKETAPVVTVAKIKRPKRLDGHTFRKETPIGTAYVTINDFNNQPFEVFVNVGKAGSEVAAVSEAMGRLVSLVMRLSSDDVPTDRMRAVINELGMIGGGRHVGFGPHRVKSLPDGLAQVFVDYLGDGVAVEDPKPVAAFVSGEICPDCGEASLHYAEGCNKCISCGYSEC